MRTQHLLCRNMPFRAWREIQLCSQRANAAMLSHEQSCAPGVRTQQFFAGTCLSAHGERSKCACGVRAQQSCRMNISLCLVCGWRSRWRGFHVCSRIICPDVLLNMSPRKVLCAAGIPRVLGWQLPRRVIEHHLAFAEAPTPSIAVLVLRRERVSACCEHSMRACGNFNCCATQPARLQKNMLLTQMHGTSRQGINFACARGAVAPMRRLPSV